MNPIVENIVQPLVDRSVNLATVGVKRSRKLAETSADWVAASTKGVAKASDKGLKLNKISHTMLARLLTEQSHMIEGSLKAFAKRLDVAANADSFSALWNGQVEMLPKTRKRLAQDGQKVVAVFTETGVELRDWVAETVREFGQSGETITKRTAKSAKKTARKTAKKTGKKVSGATKTARKKTTKAVKNVKKTAKRRTRRAA